MIFKAYIAFQSREGSVGKIEISDTLLKGCKTCLPKGPESRSARWSAVGPWNDDFLSNDPSNSVARIHECLKSGDQTPGSLYMNGLGTRTRKVKGAMQAAFGDGESTVNRKLECLMRNFKASSTNIREADEAF